jgi:hypothetical protein
MDVEFEAVGAARESVVEGGDGVLGPQRRATSMRVDLGHGPPS